MEHHIRNGHELAWGGKLPAMGDFVWSAERTQLRAGLDHWLESGLQQFRLCVGDPWRTAFDQAPMWNFVVPSRALAASWVAGCISPSCDRVGRRFPLVVAYRFPEAKEGAALALVMGALPELLSSTGAILFQGISRSWMRDALASALDSNFVHWPGNMGSPATEAESTSDIMDVLLGTSGHADGHITTQPLRRNHSFPWSDMARSFDPHSATSFWWTNGAGGAPLKAFTYDGPLGGLPMAWLFGNRLG